MDRRQMLKLSSAAAAAATTFTPSALAGQPAAAQVAQWDMYEITLHGPADGNPFVDTVVGARFTLGHRTIDVAGFYDGDGTYRVRFMPDTPGRWTWESIGSNPALRGLSGTILCTPPDDGIHGPVTVAHEFHFQYADGAPFFPFGTTCYACAFMGAPWEQETLDTLRTTGFNKVRLCILPKGLGHDLFALPFEKRADGTNDFSRLNPLYFQHVEKRISDLMQMGIQADVILFHPYDSWGYKSMPPEANDLYLRYVIPRLAAYRNIWWSVANEFDLIKSKTTSDWDHYFHVIQQCDPYSHLRSIHHSKVQYDNSKPWVTHASLQEYDFSKAAEYRAAWGKPIIWDEIQYEGNIARRWGNLTPEEMTRRFWLAVVSGTYATHGETYITPPGVPVWSDGGKLMGSSAPRIAFLRSLIEKITTIGISQYDGSYYLCGGEPNELYLFYFDGHAIGEYDFPLPLGIDFKGRLIDPWAMTITELPGLIRRREKLVNEVDDANAPPSSSHLKLSGKPFMAVLFQKA